METPTNNEAQRANVSTEVLQKVLDVLANMPYQQVAGLINEIQSDVRIIEKDGASDVE